ncbi:MAG: DUF2865 domain-containing protein [Hyphomicrobiaceae bacterium]
MCVRLCDGYYWPVDQHATQGRLAEDSARCEASCGSPARLFVLPAGEDGPEKMTDLQGEPYSKLPGALLYRTRYNAGCTCRAQPWQIASRERHEAYAAAEAARLAKVPAATRLARAKAQLNAMPMIKPPAAAKGRGRGVFLMSVVTTPGITPAKAATKNIGKPVRTATQPNLLARIRMAILKPSKTYAAVADAPPATIPLPQVLTNVGQPTQRSGRPAKAPPAGKDPIVGESEQPLSMPLAKVPCLSAMMHIECGQEPERSPVTR